MYLLLEDEEKKNQFTYIFQQLKVWSSILEITFKKDKLCIQTMNMSHTCFGMIELRKEWFNKYEVEVLERVVVNTTIFSDILKFGIKEENLVIELNDNDAKLNINFSNKYFYEISLLDLDTDALGAIELNHTFEFTLSTKTLIDDYCKKLFYCDDCINIKFDNVNTNANDNDENITNKIILSTPKNLTDKSLSICLSRENDIKEFYEYNYEDSDITQSIDISFSLKNILTCLNDKITEDVSLKIGNGLPLEIRYLIGKHTITIKEKDDEDNEENDDKDDNADNEDNDNEDNQVYSFVVFYVAPKVNDIDE